MNKVISPVNRHVLVERQAEEIDAFSSAFADTLKTFKEYLTVKVVKSSVDCEKITGLKEGDLIVVPANMIVEFKVDNQQFSMVQENYILAVLK